MDRPNNWSRISNQITGQQRLPLSELSLIIIQCQTKQQKLKNIDVKVVLIYFIFFRNTEFCKIFIPESKFQMEHQGEGKIIMKGAIAKKKRLLIKQQKNSIFNGKKNYYYFISNSNHVNLVLNLASTKQKEEPYTVAAAS